MQSQKLNIKIRRSRKSDAEFVEELRNQPSSRMFQASPIRTVDQIREMLSETLDLAMTNQAIGRFYWIAEMDETPVGMIQIAVDLRDRGQNSATLGYSVAEAFQGRGVATEAVRQVLPNAFNPRGLAIERLEAVAAVDNAASRRVLEKCAFQYEGIQRGLLVIAGQRVDHACYAILDSDEIVRGMRLHD